MEAEFVRLVLSNPVCAAVLARMRSLAVPDCWLTAGCLVQTVWNRLSGREPTAGIGDYDVNYFDASDLGWDAEDAVIRRAASLFADLPAARVEVRNEARVHLWYVERFGVLCAPFTSTCDAVAKFPARCSCVAIRPSSTAGYEVFAPFGLEDLFELVVRPNPVLAPREVYERKAARWRSEWPGLTIHPWTSSTCR